MFITLEWEVRFQKFKKHFVQHELQFQKTHFLSHMSPDHPTINHADKLVSKIETDNINVRLLQKTFGEQYLIQEQAMLMGLELTGDCLLTAKLQSF